MKATKDKIDNLLKQAKIGDRGYFNLEDGQEYCIANKWRNTIGEYKNFVYLVSIDYINNLKKALKEEKGVMVNADWIFKEYDYEKLLDKEINSNRDLKAEEIWFEDGIIIENGVLNALMTLDAGQVEEIYGLKELNYDEDYYDVYLDYNPKEDNCKITIVAVTEEDRQYYNYIPKPKEKEMLKNSLEEYIKSYEKKTMQELINDYEEYEREI